MELYSKNVKSDRENISVPEKAFNAVNAWLLGIEPAKEATEGSASNMVGSALKSVQHEADPGNSYQGIPSIRNRLQYRESSASAILNLGNIKNVEDVVRRRIAQTMYGNLDITTEEGSKLYDRIREEYKDGTDTNGNPEGFIKKIFTAAVGTAGTQVDANADIMKLGLGAVKAKSLDSFKSYLKEKFAPAGENRAKFMNEVENLSSFDISKLTDIMKESGPVQDVKDLAKIPGMLSSLAHTIGETAVGLTPFSDATVSESLVNGFNKTANIYDQFKKSFKWIKSFMTDEFLLGPSNSLVGSISDLRSRIMGLPPALLHAVDPMARAYTNNVIATQHVMTIVPGVFDYTGIAFAYNHGFSSAALEEEMKAFTDGTAQTLVFDGHSTVRQLLESLDDNNRRLANFSPRIGSFLRVYNTLMGRFVARLSPTSTVAMMVSGYGDGDTAEFNKKLVTTGWGGIEFAINSNTTVSETASNSWGQGITEGMMQSYEGTWNKAKEAISGILGSNFTDFVTASKSITNFPKHWESSSFNKSYTLSFRLECPYGNTDHLLEYVYKPFIALLAMSMPVFKNENAFTSPFIIRVDCPGFFTIDAGAVTSLDIRRGVDENSWSSQGMATCLEVTMTIMDMYESMALPVGPTSFMNDFPMQAYIDNISGMNYKEIYTGGSMNSALRTYAAYARSLPDVFKQSVMAKASETTWKLPGSLWGTNKNR